MNKKSQKEFAAMRRAWENLASEEKHRRRGGSWFLGVEWPAATGEVRASVTVAAAMAVVSVNRAILWNDRFISAAVLWNNRTRKVTGIESSRFGFDNIDIAVSLSGVGEMIFLSFCVGQSPKYLFGLL